MPDPVIPPNTTARPGGKPGVGEWVSEHKGIAIGGLLVAAVGAYLIIRGKKSSSSSSSQSLNSTATPASLYPYSTGVTGSNNAGDYYAGILNQLNSNSSALSSQLTGLGTSITSLINAGTAAGNPASGATNNGSSSGSAVAPQQYGYGTINLPGIGESVILGNVTSGQGANADYTGYNVGGGAPVYFGNANGAAQGPQAINAGSYAYTPVAYEGLVSSGITANEVI